VKRRAPIQWRIHAIDLAVAIIGLFVALQLDEWRSDRHESAAETRYLAALHEDLKAFVSGATVALEEQKDRRDAVIQVYRSLVNRNLPSQNVDTFSKGILRVGYLPSTLLVRSSYDEMVASGMFAKIRSEELRKELSRLFALQDATERNFSWWRSGVLELVEKLNSRVEFGNPQLLSNGNRMIAVEKFDSVGYDFEVLTDDQYLKNAFFWAADVHSDWVDEMGRLLRSAIRADTILSAELLERSR
jgi:hypothetical protein